MDPTTSPAAEECTTLYHRRHARQQVGKSFGHFGPAVVLLFGIAPVLGGDEPFTLLRALEVLIGAAYLVLMVREWRLLRHNPHHREPVAWLELAAAAILALESYHIWHRHHEAELAGQPHRLHVLPWLYAAIAAVFVVLAFRMRQLDGRLFLHLHPAGFAVRTSRLGRAHRLRWAEVAAVEPAGPADALVRCTDGQTHRIAFADLHEGPAHRDRLLAHAAGHLAPAPKPG
ncbi:hypothetical protein [Hymenobacter ruricola]|uniref:PH domain-containing protein n=1 Tax=Hymenobacter ruricola TaxID=2791023 RepID=A0ABS0IAW8_9BACT|nr:hypothetical protein [Hymenobacter ruricola]MBF9224124.1 hypothetical protein [Hymenobacter ruricola]